MRRPWLVYTVAVALVWVVWVTYMVDADRWGLLIEHWTVSITMVFGSFVAGATAEGGGAVAFPVFTKALHIAPADACVFALMIQSVGMTMASLVLILRRVPVLPAVIGWVSLGGVVGQVAGTWWLHIPARDSRVLFTCVAASFGVALAIIRISGMPTAARLPDRFDPRLLMLAVGLAGGVFAANTGSGIDMVTFIVLTLMFGIHEKISTPTTVIIMAINSVVGFALHGIFRQDIGVAADYWLAAIPIVVIGAPLGALLATKATRDHLIGLLLTLISLEVISTIVLVPFGRSSLLLALGAVLSAAVLFPLMLRARFRIMLGSVS